MQSPKENEKKMTNGLLDGLYQIVNQLSQQKQRQSISFPATMNLFHSLGKLGKVIMITSLLTLSHDLNQNDTPLNLSETSGKKPVNPPEKR